MISWGFFIIFVETINIMKNTHILPTDQPSRLHYYFGMTKRYALSKESLNWRTASHLYITSDEEIKEDDWGLSRLNEVILFGRSYPKTLYKKIILTTDPTLIADGVQAIYDEFLEWFVKNSSCEFVVIDWSPLSKNLYGWKIIIPQEEPKQDFSKEWKELEDDNLCEPLKSWDETSEEVDSLVNELINKFTDWSGSYVYRDKLIEIYEQLKKK